MSIAEEIFVGQLKDEEALGFLLSEPRGALDEQVQKAGITTRMTANGTYIPKNQVPPAGLK